MPILGINLAAKAAISVYSIALAGAMTYFVVQAVRDDRTKRKQAVEKESV